jgi:hypothetical protein
MVAGRVTNAYSRERVARWATRDMRDLGKCIFREAAARFRVEVVHGLRAGGAERAWCTAHTRLHIAPCIAGQLLGQMASAMQ